MKLAFIIERRSYYRLLGPIIDEALAQGLEVECWHNYGHPQTGLKGYQFPSIALAPTFGNGRPALTPYHEIDELRRWLLQHRADVVIALHPPSRYFADPPRESLPKWVGVQYAAEFFTQDPSWGLLACDVIAVYSDWWVRWVMAYWQQEGRVSPACEQRLREKVVVVGFPELDQVRLINPAAIRRRWGIPPDQPVVALLPFPGSIHPSFWARKIFLEPHPLKQAANVVLDGRFKYWPHILHGWTDIRMVQAVREFCDRQQAHLLVKSRLKTPTPAYTKTLADTHVVDESDYPSTILEVLSIANLCISFYSMAALEAAALGVPNLCLTFPGEDLNDEEGYAERFDPLFSPREGGIFQFRGVSTTMPIPLAIQRLPASSFADFPHDPAARQAYMKQFLGYDGGQSSRRVLEAIHRLQAGQAVQVSDAAPGGRLMRR